MLVYWKVLLSSLPFLNRTNGFVGSLGCAQCLLQEHPNPYSTCNSKPLQTHPPKQTTSQDSVPLNTTSTPNVGP